MGVVSGVVMSFQFGTNWPGYMEKAGEIAGPLLGYEVLTAFFLEASFLGVMLYGKHRVPNHVHLFASFTVAAGTTLSSFWILSLNSWMQTPSGFEISDTGRFIVTSWWEVIFNPSFGVRFFHHFFAAFITASFLLAGLSAWRILANKKDEAATKILYSSIILLAILTPIQIFVGDLHGLNSLKHQPAKIAAMEGLWHTESGAPLVLFAIPDHNTQSNRFSIEIPKLASLILTHDPNGKVQGLNEFKDIPNVPMVFYSFRIMVGMGILMMTLAWCGAYALWRHQRISNYLLRFFKWMTYSGWIAVLAGWYVTEAGRQPWIIYEQVRTEEVVATHLPQTVGFSLILYAVLYSSLLIAYILVMRYLALRPQQEQ